MTKPEHFSHLVPGWFDYADLYEEVVRGAPKDATLVEVGSYMGASFAHLCVEAIREERFDLRLVAIDLWDDAVHAPALEHTGYAPSLYGGFLKTVERIYDAAPTMPIARLDVNWLRQRSNAPVDFDAHFVFIDAGHDYESVRADIEAWLPRVQPGGILAGHDVPHGDVRRAVEERFGAEGAGWTWRRASCWVVQR